MAKKLAKISSLLMLLLSACAAGGNQLKGEAHWQGKDLLIEGQSDLPDKTLLTIALLDPQKPAEMNRNVMVQEFAMLKAGAFTAKLSPKALAAGKYQLRIRFDPASYDPSQGAVVEVAGAKGEKLSGPQVVSEGDVKMLESIQEIEYTP